jgi:hypothetical protein
MRFTITLVAGLLMLSTVTSVRNPRTDEDMLPGESMPAFVAISPVEMVVMAGQWLILYS